MKITKISKSGIDLIKNGDSSTKGFLVDVEDITEA
jgi:hypothetical protein